MALRRYGSFTGGIDLPDEKDRTLTAPIVACPAPSRLLIPLSSCAAAAAEPTVSPGTRLSAGERIAAAGARGVDVFSPLAGRFTRLTTCRVLDRDGWREVPAMELADPDVPEPLHPLEPHNDVSGLSPEEIPDRLAAGGLVTSHRRPKSLAWLLRTARQAGCHTLICNGMEGQPYIAAAHRLLAEQGPAVVRGMHLLARAAGVRRVVLAADQRRTSSYRELIGPARQYDIERLALPHKYPTGAPPVLVKVVTRREVPLGHSPLAAGALVVDPATCFAAWRWLACGEPHTHRVVTVAGNACAKPRNLWAPFGVELAALLGDVDHPIASSPMIGVRLHPGGVVTSACDAALAMTPPAPEPAGPCIRCSWCMDHCPARLNVAALNDAFEEGRIDRAGAFGAPACVECGVCSYVCPARLPLSQRVRQLKRTVLLLRRNMPLFQRMRGRK